MRTFDFGKNWADFSQQRLDSRRLAIAVESLQQLLQRGDLRSTTFLDVGCGSGLFSLAAHRLGAAKVVGVDINPLCIQVSEYNRDHLSPQAPLEFRQASALDPASLQPLGEFDTVYAWGSLHHTGAMWQAIQNVSERVAPKGTFVLAIYNKHITSRTWHFIKWYYNRVPGWAQRIMAVGFGGIIYLAKLLVTRQNPLNKERGMDFWYDVIDWIGGYPYEYATEQEIIDFVESRGFKLHHCVAAQVPTGCNEFVFERT